MTPQLVSLILWAPFLLAALIAGIIFCIKGYKQGLWRALISLGVTLVAAVLSMVIANLIAPLLVPVLTVFLPSLEIPSELPIPADFVESLIHGVIQDVLSLVLFGVLLFLLTFILKLVFNAIKRRSLVTEKKALRFAGMGVRLVDALLYALLLFLPLYGTLATYAPVAQTVAPYVLSESENYEEIQAYLDAVAGHPVVYMSKASPAAVFYNNLSGFQVNDSTVNIPEIVQTAEKTVTMLEKLAEKDIEDYGEEELELIDHLRENVVGADWFYSIASEIMTAVKDAFAEEFAESDLGVELDALMADMSKEDMQANCEVFLDLAEFAIRNGIVPSLMDGTADPIDLYEKGLFDELSKAVNHSPQLVAVKTLLVQSFLADLYEASPDLSENLRKTITVKQLTDPADLKAEAEAFAVLAAGQNSTSLFDFVIRHPMFSDEATDILLQAFPMTEMLDLWFMGDDYKLPAAVETALIQKLYDTGSTPVSQPVFSDYCDAVRNVLYLFKTTDSFSLSSVSSPLFAKGGAPVKFAIETLGEDYLMSICESSAKEEMLDLLKKSADASEKVDLSSDEDLLSGYRALLELMSKAKDDALPEDVSKENLNGTLFTIVDSDMYLVLAEVVKAHGTDPVGIGSKLSSTSKERLNAQIAHAVSTAENPPVQEGGNGDFFFGTSDSEGGIKFEQFNSDSSADGNVSFSTSVEIFDGDGELVYSTINGGSGGIFAGDVVINGAFSGSMIISGNYIPDLPVEEIRARLDVLSSVFGL